MLVDATGAAYRRVRRDAVPDTVLIGSAVSVASPWNVAGIMEQDVRL